MNRVFYILQFLYPCPHVSMNFNAQKKDPKNSNDDVASIFGTGAQNRFRYFKGFFGVGCTKDCTTLAQPSKLEYWLVRGLDQQNIYIGLDSLINHIM